MILISRTYNNSDARVPDEYHEKVFSKCLKQYFGRNDNILSEAKNKEHLFYFQNLLSKKTLENFTNDHKDFKKYLKNQNIE